MTKITEFMRTDVHSVHENTSFETLMCQDICTIADHVYVCLLYTSDAADE